MSSEFQICRKCRYPVTCEAGKRCHNNEYFQLFTDRDPETGIRTERPTQTDQPSAVYSDEQPK